MQNTAVQLMTGRLECQSVVMPVTQQTKRNKASLHAKHEIPKHVSQKEKMKTRINTRGGELRPCGLRLTKWHTLHQRASALSSSCLTQHLETLRS